MSSKRLGKVRSIGADFDVPENFPANEDPNILNHENQTLPLTSCVKTQSPYPESTRHQL